MFTAAKPPVPDGFIPGVGMPGGADIPKPQGLYTYALIGPDVWPPESESGLSATADQLKSRARQSESAAAAAKAQSDNVFSTYWTAGDGATAAEEHYRNEHFLHETLIEAMRFVSGGYARLGENFRTIKRKMREANDEAHHEIEQTLRANNNQPVGVGPILTKYRTLINEYSIELRGIVGDETAMLSNEFSQSPPAQSGEQTGRGKPGEGTADASRRPR